MVTIEELKLGNKTLEALKFLLLQINELDVILNELNFEELREANNQAKTQIEVLNNIKTLVLNTEKSIEQAKALVDSRSDEVNIAKREIEDVKTNIIKVKDDATLIYENISSKSERIEQKYNDIAEIKKEVDKKFDDIKSIETQSRDIANEITNNKNITLRKIDENVNTLNNTISNINILKNETLQEIATTKASIDTKANEALSQASTSLADIKAIVADFKGKQTELNALKASLETLKSSLESLNKSGLINDSQAGVAQTYSSNKINNLLQGVLRESDAAEGNTAGKLVKRNAQGNIYATNVYLNATTKAEVSDIKSSLATDKWRFIVRDTGEGLLRSMSIKDFINSQEVDAYKKSESDNRYLAKSEASTDNEANKVVVRGQNGFISVGTIASYTSITSPAYDIFLEKNNYDYTFGVFFNNSLYRVRARDIKGYLDNYYADKKITEKGLNDIRANIPPRNKPNGYAGLDAKGKITLDLLPYTENIVELSNEMSIDPRKGKNFIITLDSTRGDFSFWPTQFGVGQGGVIVVKGANRIESWNSNIKWREVPTDLGEIEVFSYFIASASEVYMGRA